MTSAINASKTASGTEVSITRIFDAPRERVFKAWASQDILSRWYAPDGCSIRIHKLEFKPGGAFHTCIVIPDGKECWCVGTYRDIIVPEKIVFSMSIADAAGNLLEPTQCGMDPEWPRDTIVTVTFAEQNGKTKLTLHQTVLESIAIRTGAHPSWLSMLERLATELKAEN